jgi:excisionase family DNA binding protein
MLERPLTTTQVSRIMNISKTTVVNLAKKETNPLPSIRVGKHYRFFLSDIKKYFGISDDKLVESKTQSIGASNE